MEDILEVKLQRNENKAIAIVWESYHTIPVSAATSATAVTATSITSTTTTGWNF